MKKLLLFVALLGATNLNSQIVYDFETDVTSVSLQYFASSLFGTLVPVVDNPNQSGINQSSKVIEFTRAAGSEVYAGAYSTSPLIAPIEAKSGGKICVDVYFDHIGSLALKVEGADTDSDHWIFQVANTKVNEWETICFDFDMNSIENTPEPASGNVYKSLTIFPDLYLEAGTEDVIFYLDNIIYEGGGANSNVTFKVDVNEIEVAESGIFLAGNVINNWTPSQTPMNDDDGNGVWEVTIPLPPGPVQYSFANGSMVEVLVEDDCTIVNGNFINRALTVGDVDQILPIYLFGSCDSPSNGSQVVYDFETDETTLGFQYFASSLDGTIVPVTENPDATGTNESSQVLAFTRAAGSETYAGAFSNSALIAPVDAINGGSICMDVFFDHIGSLALKLEGAPGDPDNWIFQMANTKVNEWETLCFDLTQNSIENTPEPATGNQYSTIVIFPDFLAASGAADVIFYLDNITYLGVEVDEVETYNVTFSVDMSNEIVGENGVFVSGEVINGWSPSSTPMEDTDGDGIYEVSVMLPPGDIEYKFVNSGSYEEFAEEGECNISDPSGQSINRLLTLEPSDTIIQTYFFNSCGISSDVENLVFDKELFKIAPNVANDFVKISWTNVESKRLTIMNANGQKLEQIISPKFETEKILNVGDYASGIYFIRMDTPTSYGIEKIIVR